MEEGRPHESNDAGFDQRSHCATVSSGRFRRSDESRDSGLDLTPSSPRTSARTPEADIARQMALALRRGEEEIAIQVALALQREREQHHVPIAKPEPAKSPRVITFPGAG
jgi:hypothetical protein